MDSSGRTRQFSVGRNLYCLLPHPPAKLSPQQSTGLGKRDGDLLPLTIITWTQRGFTDHDVQSVSEQFSIEDDVWSRGFLSVILLLQPQDLHCEVKTNTTVLILSKPNLKLANGPLYEDTHHAFVNGILPRTTRKDDFRTLKLCTRGKPSGSGQGAPSSSEPVKIPVPSRLYSRLSRSKPLAGLRIAVKDAIHLQGLKTGFGSNAWQELHPPEKTTAPAIRLLLAAGAVIVGKVKTSEFCEGVDPHQWIGSTCPVNPRGDGEQKPSSSSTGSAVAAAAYPWLDCTIGTDTGGSIRHPAGVNGIFGNRPTQTAIDLSGVLGATDLLNTLGIFTRDATTFSKIGTQLLPKSFQPLIPRSARKFKLLYPVRSLQRENPDPHRWFPNPIDDPARLTEAEKQMEAFVQQFEHHLSCQRRPFNLAELWRALKPRGQPESLDEATGGIYSALVSYSALHEGGITNFINTYAASHAGLHPEISPIVQKRHDYGRSLPVAEIARHLDAMAVFAHWVENVLFGPPDEEAITLLVFPQSFGVPRYRDDIPADDCIVYDTFSVFSFGYLVGCPDYTVPIGEVPFVSRVTGREGYLPVSVSLVARRGNDVPLFDVLTALEEQRVLRGVKAGRRMYD